MTIIRESRPAPLGNGQGPFAAPPLGVLLHGSRGGAATLAQEYTGTANWAVTNPSGLAWHATIGEDRYGVHLPPGVWGWHAREASRVYLGVEFAQPTVDHVITAGQVAAFVAWFRAEVLPAWPHLASLTAAMLPVHSETAAGQRDGKSDTYPRGDGRNDDLRRRILAALHGPPPADPTDAALEAQWRKHRPAAGNKRFAAMLDRPYHAGKVLVCERLILTPTGPLNWAGQVDDLVTLWEDHGVLRRY